MSEQSTRDQDSPQVEYRNIPGYPGYRVGSDGTVWTSKSRTGRGGPIPWRQLRFKIDKHGRPLVSLCHKAKARCFHIGVLVLTSFVSPRPEGMECCHFPDRDTGNNRLDNLRWDTRSGNMQDALRHGTLRIGSRSNLAKLTEEEVVSIRMLGAQRVPRRAIAEQFGICKRHVFTILSGKSWSALLGTPQEVS